MARTFIETVLCVNAHAPTQALLQKALARRADAQWHGAASGMEAWRVGAVLQPALLLVNLQLPDCNGVQLLEMLRLRAGWDDIPAVALGAEPGFSLDGTGFDASWPLPLNPVWVDVRLDALLRQPAMPGAGPGASLGSLSRRLASQAPAAALWR